MSFSFSSRLAQILVSALLGPAAAACSSSKNGGAPGGGSGACNPLDAVVAMSDYTSSDVGALSIASGAVAPTSGVDLGGDPGLSVSHGRLFYVARDNDTVFELDPRCGNATEKMNVHGNAMGTTDPQDVAVAPDGALWLPRFNVPQIAVVGADATHAVDVIDLSMYDGDGNPQASAVAIADVGGAAKAFVALERLDDKDGFKAKQASQMLRIDVATRKVEMAIDLAAKNPFGTMEATSDALFLADVGDLAVADETTAGVERFDLAASTTRLLVREADMGGSVVQIAVTAGCGAAIVADASAMMNRTSLVTFDPDKGTVLAKAVLGPTEAYDLQGLAWTQGGRVLLVGDRRPSGGGFPDHVFDAAGCALTARAAPILVAQKPVAIRALPASL
jgi:hypothetical protein